MLIKTRTPKKTRLRKRRKLIKRRTLRKLAAASRHTSVLSPTLDSLNLPLTKAFIVS
jgi:hypothetical protein